MPASAERTSENAGRYVQSRWSFGQANSHPRPANPATLPSPQRQPDQYQERPRTAAGRGRKPPLGQGGRAYASSPPLNPARISSARLCNSICRYPASITPSRSLPHGIPSASAHMTHRPAISPVMYRSVRSRSSATSAAFSGGSVACGFRVRTLSMLAPGPPGAANDVDVAPLT